MQIKALVQFVKFGIVGVSNTLIAYGTYAVLTFMGVPYILSSIVGFIVSVLNSFYWNNKYVFVATDSRPILLTLFKTFLCYGSTGLVLSNILLYIFVSVLSFNKYLAPLLGLVITIPLNFLINKKWAFK